MPSFSIIQITLDFQIIFIYFFFIFKHFYFSGFLSKSESVEARKYVDNTKYSIDQVFVKPKEDPVSFFVFSLITDLDVRRSRCATHAA